MNQLFQRLLVAPKILIFLVIISPIVGLALTSTAIASNILKSKLITQLEFQANDSSEEMIRYIETAKSTTKNLSDLSIAVDYLSLINNAANAQQDPQKVAQLSSELRAILRRQINADQYIDHVRFIALNGEEMIRINQELQGFSLKNVSQRDYFQKALKLKRGTIYTSAISLNREGMNASLEHPYKPILRMVAPVYDKKDQIQGVFVANILANKIFENAYNQQLKKDYNMQVLIVDKQGYYLDHPNPSAEYGFEFNNPELNLSASLKDLKENLSDQHGFEFNNPELNSSSSLEDLDFQDEFEAKYPKIDLSASPNSFTYNGDVPVPVAWRLLWTFIQGRETGLVDNLKITGEPYFAFFQKVDYAEDDPNLSFIVTYLIPKRLAFAPVIDFTWIVSYLTVASIVIMTFLLHHVNKANSEIFKSYQQKEQAMLEKKVAIKNNRFKSVFLSSMSHEIRTPLNGILGLVEILQLISSDPAQKEYLSIIDSSGNHLLELINEILDLSKIESGEIKIDFQEFNLHSLIDVIFAIFHKRVAEKNINLKSDIEENLSDSYIGDPFRLRQILINLIGNAIKFTENGDIVVSIQGSLEYPQDFNDEELKSSLVYNPSNFEHAIFLKFSIKDSGIGMEKEVQEKIFIPFAQADNSIEKQYGGTGLGLAITKQLVELMGGEIRVESKVNQGSTFSFGVMLGVLPTGTVPHTVEESNLSSSPLESFENKKILVAEDNIVNQKVITLALEKLGCIIKIVSDGQQAVDLLDADPNGYDLVFMDYHMPVLDGLVATQKIRANPHCESLPIIALTASAMTEEIDRCLEAGMNDVVLKPAKIAAIQAVLEKWLFKVHR